MGTSGHLLPMTPWHRTPADRSFHKVAIYVELAQLSCAQMQIVNVLKQRLIHNIPSLLALTDLILNSSVKIMKL